jgi:hypothetical protein
MEALREAPIQLIHDKELEEEAGPYYGKYLGTFLSARGQLRADLFDEGSKVVAWISFPTGLNASNVEDRYVDVLDDYASKQGFAERFSMVYTES